MTSEFTFESANGEKRLHGCSWTPENPRAVVQIAHGMAEHIARYADFAAFLNAAGFAVYGSDHAGHGKSAESEEDYGYFYDRDGWNQAVADLHVLTQRIREEHPGLPVFLLGHSMGSFMARRYVTLYGEQLRGAVFVGTMGPNPMAGAGIVVARLERLRLGPKGRSKLLDKLAFGSYNNAYPEKRTAFDWLSTDEAVVDAYIEDPQCGFLFTTTGIYDLLTGVRGISSPAWARQAPTTLPVLLVSGQQDPVGGMGKGVLEVARRLQEAGVPAQCRLYPEGRHEILNEVNKGEVYQDILTWMESALEA